MLHSCPLGDLTRITRRWRSYPANNSRVRFFVTTDRVRLSKVAPIIETQGNRFWRSVLRDHRVLTHRLILKTTPHPG